MKSKICFIYPSKQMANKLYYTKKIWKIYSKNAIKLPSLALAYLASTMREKGYEVMIIDANAEDLSVCEVIKRLWKEQPDYLCFSTITDTFQETLESIREIKQMCNKPVIIGGPHMSIYPKESLKYDVIDYGVVGDGFETFPELIKTLDEEKDISKVKGICYRKKGEVVLNSPRCSRVNLDQVPFPARDLLPNNKYNIVLSQRKPVTVMVTALGCPFKCAYCCTDTNVVYRSPENVVDEIEDCIKLGIREIDFYDETFTINRKRTIEILNLIKERNLDILWSIRTRVDCVDKELINRMAEVGCIRINYGIESADEDVLKSVDRYMKIDRVREVVKWTKDAGITVLGFFMIGLPGETRSQMYRTLDLMKELDLDFIQLNKFTPIPNSKIYHKMVEEHKIDYWKEYVKGNYPLERIPHYKLTITNEKLDKLLEKGYNEFYFRPSYIWKKLKGIRSFGEFWRLAKGALDLK